MIRRLMLAALAALGPTSALAQNVIQPHDYSTMVGTTAAKVIPAAESGVRRGFLILQVDTSGSTVSCSWTTASPTLWGAGTFTLAGQAAPLILKDPDVPTSDLYCVASAAGTVLTAQAFPQ